MVDGAAGCPSASQLHGWAEPIDHFPTAGFTPLLVAGSALREKRELVPLELPGVEKEEEEAGTGRGKHPIAAQGCPMLWGQ